MSRATLRRLVLLLLMVFCTLFYYFDELANWVSWDVLGNSFLYGVHDIHRLLFLVPIVYAGYTGRVKGALVVTMVAFVIFLPRALFISPYPDPLLRVVLFAVFAGITGAIAGTARNQAVRIRELEAALDRERGQLRRE